MKYLALGTRIQTFRKEAGLSLEEVAKMTGISKGQLERFESDEEQPIIAHLIKLSKALGVNVADIFRARPSKRSFEVIRRADRQKIRPLLEPTRGARIFDYSYELLTHPGGDKHIDAYLIELPPHSGKPPSKNVTHEGEEFLYVLEGEIQGEIGGAKFHLKAGDSLYLRSSAPHVFYNPTDRPTRAVAVVYPF